MNITLETQVSRQPVAVMCKATGSLYFANDQKQVIMLQSLSGQAFLTTYLYLERVINNNPDMIPLFKGDRLNLVL